MRSRSCVRVPASGNLDCVLILDYKSCGFDFVAAGDVQ